MSEALVAGRGSRRPRPQPHATLGSSPSGVPHRGHGAVRNAGSRRARPNLVLAFFTAAMAW